MWNKATAVLSGCQPNRSPVTRDRADSNATQAGQRWGAMLAQSADHQHSDADQLEEPGRRFSPGDCGTRSALALVSQLTRQARVEAWRSERS